MQNNTDNSRQIEASTPPHTNTREDTTTPGPAGHLGYPSDPGNAQPAGVEELKYSCLYPPVTKATLSKLDDSEIFYIPKLRHDMNFDLDLRFKPNLDGESGRRKKREATEFWNLLTVELCEFMDNSVSFSGREWCLSRTLRETSEILSTLVPPKDRSSVEEFLNLELQQLRKGVANFERLASWLSRTLKSCCSSPREKSVDKMSEYLSTGSNTRNVAEKVLGLQTLLYVLEAMKLDVANYQLHCSRLLLIRDTAECEQKFFREEIASGKIDERAAKSWFQAAKLSSLEAQVQTSNLSGDSWALFYGFASLLFPSKSSTKVPDTYMFDEERIIELRSDMLDAVNLDICIRLFQSKQDEQRDSPRQTSASGSPGPSASHNITASTPPVFPLSPSITIGQSVLGIIDDVSGSNRWQQSCLAIAHELARNSKLDFLSTFESQLKDYISNLRSPVFLASEANVLAEFIPLLSGFASHYTALTLTQLFEANKPPKPVPGQLPEPRQVPEGMAKRSAHIVALHQHIWEPLVYRFESTNPSV